MYIIKLYNQYKTYIRCFAVTIIVLVTGALYYGMHGSGKDKSGADIYTSSRHETSSYSGVSALDEDADRASVSSVDSDSLDAAVLRGTQENKELIYVYVYGEVNNPGVVGCKKDSRVYEVVELCGGYTVNANESCINPVRKVSDGEKIYIPYVGEDYSHGIYDDDSYKTSQEYAASLYGDYGASQQNTRININTAAKEQLVTLPGIGTSRAEDIISYRSKNGSFKSIEDIKNVPGIKDGAFAKIKDYICV